MDKQTEIINLLSNLLIISDGKQLKPVKNTSKQDIYYTILRLQFLLGIPNRFYPNEWEKEGLNGQA